MRSSLLVGSAVSAAVLALVPAVASASVAHDAPVAARSQTNLPQVVPSAAVAGPHVDAIATGGGTTYAGGFFDTLTQGGAQRTGLGNIAAFSTSSGAISTSFDASVNGQVWDLELDAANNALYAAGDFTSVNGNPRAGLVKLNATTGATDPTFTPYFSVGKVNDISLVNVAGKTRLLVGGGMGRKLASVNPATGKLDGYSFPGISGAIPGAWGGVAVYRFSVDPSGTRLVATGNFQTVGAASRTRLVMLNLGATGATVDDWYYEPFAKPCSSTAARRIAYLQGVDWSPSGSHFSVAATGQISKPGDVWHSWDTAAVKAQATVCDAVGRFDARDDSTPQWINYTGGDSVWRVQDTGAAVYASGHFQWLDNADGYASLGIGDKGKAGVAPATPAVNRLAIGAINPNTGRALAWAPQAAQFKQGGKALMATPQGLWIGNDSKRFGGQARYGLAFAPVV